MNMYEIILDIIEKNGPVSFHSICEEMNEMEKMKNARKNPIQVSHVKSVVSRKKDLFSVEDNIVSIREEKELLALVAMIGCYPGPTYKIHVDFAQNRFFFFEWNIDCVSPERKERTIYIGDVEQFKKEIIRLKIWNWERDYQLNSLVLDGTSWSVKLKTKGKVYESEGLQSFPKNWAKFSKAVSQLIGVKFE
ncbi:hypothetical protein [Robertmurraya andreesenii]|uniref:Uncharacterized protein n=1 Tax=Anoxybacillus andreesenii TaxID=1325932 RepID=A0ABT9V6U9_9BACL|nr:hypothetical protein [Robertmurraya andreesenii]MDQ0156657.1 hypothetical protein [Robertmurraya andreesenii]